MSFRYRIHNPSKLIVRRLQRSLERLRGYLQTNEGGNITSALLGITESFQKVLQRLDRPAFDPKYLAEDADPDPASWNANLERIEDDLRILFDEEQTIRTLRMDVANAGSLAAEELRQKANMATSLVTDLRLLEGQLDQEVIVAKDDFVDSSKVDSTFAYVFPQAEVNPLQGVVTLRRTEAINVITDDAEVQVVPLAPEALLDPSTDMGRMPTPDNTFRFYEGRFFAPIGEPRPEGGKWHLEEKVAPGIVVSGGEDVVYTLGQDLDGNPIDIFESFPDLAQAAADRPAGLPLRPEDIIVLDRGASLEELQTSRKRMLDGSPDSFWESEFVIDSTKLDELVADREAAEATVTPQELRARASQADIDKYDFEVEIVIRLLRRQVVNYITINPMNFKETAWLEVTEVSTATDENDAFIPIDGFDVSRFENILTDEANAELSEGKASTVLAANRYAFRGMGVYTFSPREVARVRVRLKQRTPVPSNYERVVVQLTRTLSATETNFDADYGGIL